MKIQDINPAIFRNSAPLNSSQKVRSSDSINYIQESLSVDLQLKDGTSISIDWTYEALSRKTEFEFSNFSNFSYANDHFSPENTAGRILDFAKALWDGTGTHLDSLAGAIDQGVQEALDILGELPEWLDSIIGQTVELLTKGIDEIRAELIAEEV